MWRRKIPLAVKPEEHARGYEIRIPVKGYRVRLTRETVRYDVLRLPLKTSGPRRRRARRASTTD
jgi:hypothetical protein